MRGEKQRGNSERVIADALRWSLDLLPIGVMLVDENGRALLTNGLAREVLKENDGPSIDGDRCLFAEQSRDGTILVELIKATRPDLIAEPGSGLGMVIARHIGDLEVVVRPLSEGCPSRDIGAVAAVFISDRSRRVTTNDAILRDLYGLTRAEAAVTSMLVRGKSVEELSEELGISPLTARTHLKRVFSKTSTTRQADLVSRLLSGPAFLRL